MPDRKLLSALNDARARELRAAQLYRLLGEREADTRRRDLFERLAQEEEKHARLFGERIVANGGTLKEGSAPITAMDRFLARTLGTEGMLRRMEAEEERNIADFGANAQALAADPISQNLFEEIEREEEAHASLLQGMRAQNDPSSRLEAILKGEKWHVNTGNWIGDAIYGMNDGLTAVFGIVSGMAGVTGNSWKHVLAAGMMATLASALSMGSSAFLATKAEREVYEAEIGREKREIEESPEHEKEELALIYQLKGLTEEEAHRTAATIAAHPETFLKTMAHEELGLTDRNFPNPWVSMLSGTVSTAIGGMIPVLPFIFMRGTSAIIASAIVSTLAHFGVGAAKTLVTNRPWVASGLEMTAVGVGMGAITYILGEVFRIG